MNEIDIIKEHLAAKKIAEDNTGIEVKMHSAECRAYNCSIAYGAGYEAGIKEVVDWIKENTTDIHSNEVMLTFYSKEWLTKLKSWNYEK